MKCDKVIIVMALIWVGTLAQQPGPEEKIPFQTKDKDACVMSISGQGEMRVRIECKNQAKNYVCVFASKPSFCRAYNKDPKGFWNQLSEDLKKTGNPCQPQVFKHSLCPKAPAPSQFKQVDSRNQQSDTSKPEKKPPPTKKPTTKKPPSTKKPDPPKPKQLEVQNPKAVKMAKENCSWFFQTFCSYIIEIFI
ncbi:fibroblast growth factor-binding protein 2 [Bufo gargarizans]|uniref:fibroblast growth factor-binding protein 2 n=1 Tax=Bufo gargarizans TaxID=30331 RepID=UPI001CF11F7C|nr:fibroblast growth factor-binding protein 2 [Bufo gargarizans]